jgi:hypothetical protein
MAPGAEDRFRYLFDSPQDRARFDLWLDRAAVLFLFARYAFDDLGYRRLEWKCDALNAPSMRAARRFGFAYEGSFRQHMMVKGRNRDAAWFAIVDAEWPSIRRAFEQWLAPANFDHRGQQKTRLADLRESSSVNLATQLKKERA